jgi:ABC-type lipoprotein export system ATPase subunit
MSKLLLEANNVERTYPMGRVFLEVLRGASLRVAEGEFVAIMGASGSGKSTLLHILGGLDAPDAGGVRFAGVDLFAISSRARERLRNRDLGFVFQFYHLLPELNVFENILLPQMIGSSVLGWLGHRGTAHRNAMDVLVSVGLGGRAKHRPNELSGGERQRAAIARAIVTNPRLLLADEPTGNLDAKTGAEILNVLTDLHAQGQTIVMVTHDERVAAKADRIVQLENGRTQASPSNPGH